MKHTFIVEIEGQDIWGEPVPIKAQQILDALNEKIDCSNLQIKDVSGWRKKKKEKND